MSVSEFIDIIENFFDSMKLTREEREYICTVYFHSYVREEHVNVLQERSRVLECANALATLMKPSKDYDLPSVPMESFQELLNVQPINFPYNCNYVYEVVKEMRTCENIFKQKISEMDCDIDDFFMEPLKLSKDDAVKLFKVLKNLFECCVATREDVHEILEIWLNTCIMPKYREGLIDKNVMDDLIHVAEITEDKYQSSTTVLNSKEAIKLVFGNDTSFKGILSLRCILDILYTKIVRKLGAGSSVSFRKEGKPLAGVIIGIHAENYIVQHECDDKGYTASVVRPEDLEEVLYDR